MVVSSHLLAEVEQTCTHVVVMHKGQLVAAGSVAEIAGAGGVQLAVADPAEATRVLAAAGIAAETVPARRALEDVFLDLIGDDAMSEPRPVRPRCTERELSERRRRPGAACHDRLAAARRRPRAGLTTRARTLRLRVEFARQLKRRRTQVAFGLLLVLPIIIALAFKIGGGAERQTRRSWSGSRPPGGFNFALFTEFASVGFLLVVVVALFCGDTVASEASWSSLRYLLAQPVPRSRLLRQKLIVAGCAVRRGERCCCRCGRSSSAALFFGWAPARSPIGGSFDTGASSWRLRHRRRLHLRPAAGRRVAGVPAQRQRRQPARRGRRRGDARGGVEHPRPDHRARPVPRSTCRRTSSTRGSTR